MLISADGITIDTATGIAVVVCLGGTIALLFKLLMAAKDKEHERTILELEGVKKSYQEIASEAIKSATETTNYYRAKEGKPPLVQAAPVVSESHSPSTAKQRETAATATMRAEMAMIKLATGQEPRQEPEQAVEPMRADGSVQ